MNTLSGLRSYDTVLTLDGLSQFDSSIQTQALLIDGSNAMDADINANGHVVKNLDIGVNASDSCTYGQMTTADSALSSALTASYTAADTNLSTTLTTAYTLADTAQTTSITAAFTSADNLRLLLAGGVMSGTVSSTTVTTPFDYKNPNGTIIAKLEAGTTAVTNNCILQMSSNASSILEFRDNLALNVKAQLKYTYGAPGSLSMIIAGVTALSTSNTAATFNVPVTLNSPATSGAHAVRYDQTLTLDGTHQMQAAINCGGFKVANSAAGSAGSADCATVAQMEAADAVVNAARIAGDGVVTTNYIAADAVVVASSVQKTGSALTGGLTWSNVATPISAVNTGGPINVSLSAGTSSATQVCSMKMASNSQSYTEFTDVAGVTKAWIRYLASGGGSIDLTVANNPMATLTSSTVTLGGTVQLGGNRVTGMGAPTADTDAATRLYVTNADAAVTASSVQKSGSTMSGSLNMGGTNRVTNMAASSVDGDAVRRQELYGVYLPLSGGTMTGALVANAGLTVNGAGITVNAPTVMNGNLTINGGVLARNMWYPGETIQRKWLSPALSDTLAETTIAAASSEIIVTTTLPVTAYNHVIVRGAFEVTANNSANDTYRIEFGFSTQTVTFNNVLGAVNGYRTRYNVYEFMFVPTSSGTKTIKATLHNDSTSDTITVSDLNWTWTLEEIQA